MTAGSEVHVLYDGTDITSHVIAHDASWESQLNAQAGTFQITCKDLTQTLTFVTGKEMVITVDGVRLLGGYITQVSRTFALPVVDTTNPDVVSEREWVIRGVDYNILFDKRVIRNPSDYLHSLPTFSSTTMDGDLIKTLCSTYLDIPSGFDTTTYVDNVAPPFDPLKLGTHGDGTYAQQGTTWRAQMEEWAKFTGAIWYIDPNKNLINRSLENSAARWGFSDNPNKLAISGANHNYQGATFGFRELDIVEDGSNIVDEAFIWGGSAFGSTTGGTFFGHAENTTAEAMFGRWQYAEAQFGVPGYSSQDGVNSRASVIVTGIPGAEDDGLSRGLEIPQFQCQLTWFGHDVPRISGVPDHLRPGDLVTLVFFSLRDANHPAAFIITLPLRQVSISFPAIDPDGHAYVEFRGSFGLQATDPYTLWRYLLQRNSLDYSSQLATVPTADNTTTSPTFGSFGQFQVTPTPNGSNKVFHLPNAIGYIVDTTTVFVDGIFQPRDLFYTESDPPNGEITFVTAPHAGADVWVVCYTTGAMANSP